MLERLVPLFLFLVVNGVVLGADPDDPHRDLREALQAEVGEVETPGWETKTGPAMADYRRRLESISGVEGWLVGHRMGTLRLLETGDLLGINVFPPDGPSRGTLLFVHGYLSHAANFAFTFASFRAQGWTVVTLDLPGHGFSTGPRGDVASFAVYGQAVQTWLRWAQREFPAGRQVLLAHSMGASACLEAFRNPSLPRPDQIVFCAPLVQPVWYGLLVVAEKLSGWAFQTLPSRFGWDGYLDGTVMPIHWFQALQKWNADLATLGPLDLPLTIFAGDRDDTVDTEASRAKLLQVVPNAQWTSLPGKSHLFLTGHEDRQAAQLLLEQTLSSLKTVPWTAQGRLPVILPSGEEIQLHHAWHRPSGKSRGTVLFLHGYMAHLEGVPSLLNGLIQQGWTVAALDLPGHGGSEGPRYEVEDFRTYGDAVVAWLTWVNDQNWGAPQVLLAHSMGSAAALEALHRPGVPPPARAIFCAPLLQTRWFGVLRVVAWTTPWLAESRWLSALGRWVDGLADITAPHLNLTVVTPDQDRVVDTEWNLSQYRRMVPGLDVVELPGRDHWFLEKPWAREDFLLQFQALLDGSNPVAIPPVS